MHNNFMSMIWILAFIFVSFLQTILFCQNCFNVKVKRTTRSLSGHMVHEYVMHVKLDFDLLLYIHPNVACNVS